RRPVKVIERFVVAQRAESGAAFEEPAEFGPSRIFRRAQEPRNGKGAVGVGVGATGLERLLPQPAAQEPRQEGVSGAENVIDFDRESRPLDPLIESGGNGV